MFDNHYGLETAVITGRKTMTRRLATTEQPQNAQYALFVADGKRPMLGYFNDNKQHIFVDRAFHKLAESPYKEGDVLAVKQSYKTVYDWMQRIGRSPLAGEDYRLRHENSAGWQNKMFVCNDEMPFAVRIVRVDVERLQEITDNDVLREGVETLQDYPGVKPLYGWHYHKDAGDGRGFQQSYITPRCAFAHLIDRICGKGTWEADNIHFVYTFERCMTNYDYFGKYYKLLKVR